MRLSAVMLISLVKTATWELILSLFFGRKVNQITKKTFSIKIAAFIVANTVTFIAALFSGK